MVYHAGTHIVLARKGFAGTDLLAYLKHDCPDLLCESDLHADVEAFDEGRKSHHRFCGD